MESNTEKLLDLLDKLIPLVDGLADKLRILLWLLTGILLWFGIYLFQILSWGITATVIVAIIVGIPLLILLRIYWSLRSVQDIPNTLDDVTEDMQLAWKDAKSRKRGAMNVFTQAKNLYQVRGLLGNAGDIMGQYVSVGALINPFSLLLGVLSLLATLFLGLIALITLMMAVF